MRTPMTVQTFLDDERARRRYWVGSHLGWRPSRPRSPTRGTARSPISSSPASSTASSPRTSTACTCAPDPARGRHPRLDGRVRCLHCGQIFARATSPRGWRPRTRGWTSPTACSWVRTATSTGAVDEIVVPECTVCGGMLKPDVVFFGEFVPTEKFPEAERSCGRRRAGHRRIVARRQLRHPAARPGRQAPHADRDRQPRRDQGRPARDP